MPFAPLTFMTRTCAPRAAQVLKGTHQSVANALRRVMVRPRSRRGVPHARRADMDFV